MAEYTNDLRLKEIGTGESSGTWGTETNTNLELIAEAFSYGTEASFGSDADATTTIADGATDPARSLYLKITSGVSLTATRTLTIAPNTVSKIWIIENATSGSQSINISQGSGANVTIPNGDVKVVYSDGAGAGAAVVDAFINLKVTDPAQTNITSVGALDGGSITSGFGAIDTGSSNITTTGTVTGNTLAGTLSTAAQPNITSVGTLTDLDVQGDTARIQIRTNDPNDTELYFWTRNTADTAIFQSSIKGIVDGGMAFGTVNTVNTDTTERLRITATGNVGIGTSSPQDRLHVALDSATTNAEVEVMRVEATSSGTPVDGFGPFIDFRGDRQTGSPDSYGRIGFESDGMTPTTVDGAFIIQPAEDGSYTERFRVSSGGNVGIGETVPLGKLHVKSADSGASADGSADELVIEGSGDSGLSILSGASNNGTILFSDSGDSAAGGLRYEQNNTKLNFRTNGAWDKLVIDGSGNIGVSQSSPSQPSSNSTVLHMVSADNNKAASIRLNSLDDSVRVTHYPSTAGYNINMETAHPMLFSTSGSEAMRIDTSQNLLVGKTSSGLATNGFEALSTGEINSTRTNARLMALRRSAGAGTMIEFFRDATSVGSIVTATSSTSYNTSSDGRLKDITGEARGLEVINKLNPVSYNWKEDGKADEGLVAQEVLDIVPNAVSQNEEDEMYQMDYSKLVVHLVKGMKEQQAQIEALQSEINLLKGE